MPPRAGLRTSPCSSTTAQDETVPVEHLEMYPRALPQAVVRRLPERDHSSGKRWERWWGMWRGWWTKADLWVPAWTRTQHSRLSDRRNRYPLNVKSDSLGKRLQANHCACILKLPSA